MAQKFTPGAMRAAERVAGHNQNHLDCMAEIISRETGDLALRATCKEILEKFSALEEAVEQVKAALAKAEGAGDS